MRCLPDHKTYHTRAEAERKLAELIADAKRSNRGGKSWKRLNVFPCGNHFHIGRANSLPVARPAAPVPKPPTPGDLRRKAKQEARAAARRRNFICVTYGIVANPEDFADSVQIAHRMVEQLFGVTRG